MDKFVTVTKKRPADGIATNTAKRKRPMTAHEHMMHVATVPSTRGHDIWVTSASGHQVSEQGGRSVSYNEARIAKLRCQLAPPGAAVPERQKAVAARYTAQQSGAAGDLEGHTTYACPQDVSKLEETRTETRDSGHLALFDYTHSTRSTTFPARAPSQSPTSRSGGCFRGCVLYLDGYLGPQHSDWSLKRAITAAGGELCISLAKKQLTHVILSSKGTLAHSKVVKEGKMQRRTVQYVTVDWVHACLAAGKKVPAWPYSVEKLQSGTRPVMALWQEKTDKTGTIETGSELALDAEEGERLDALDR